MGKAVAELVADRLGYECLSRDVLLEASDQFNIPEISLKRAIGDAPSILERFTHGSRGYVAYIQAALTRHLCRDNIVYHGLAGSVLLRTVPHVLKVRIIADLDLRVSIVMQRDGLTHHEAVGMIKKLDRERHKWTKSLYGVDPADPGLHDLMLSIPKYEVADAADLICRSAEMPQFKTTSDSKQEMLDLALACEVKAALLQKHLEVSVGSHFGNVLVYYDGSERHHRTLKAELDALERSVSGINNVEVHAGVSPPDDAV